MGEVDGDVDGDDRKCETLATGSRNMRRKYVHILSLYLSPSLSFLSLSLIHALLHPSPSFSHGHVCRVGMMREGRVGEAKVGR